MPSPPRSPIRRGGYRQDGRDRQRGAEAVRGADDADDLLQEGKWVPHSVPGAPGDEPDARVYPQAARVVCVCVCVCVCVWWNGVVCGVSD